MRLIKLYSRKHPDKFAKVDDEDYEFLNQYRWWSCHGYAQAWINGKKVLMHRLIMKVFVGEQIDHKDQDILNNQKSNLRSCTNRQNAMNKRKTYRHCSSRFKGVSWHKQRKYWQAQISINGKGTHLGYFDTEEQAALAYDEVAKQHFGKFALVNEIR